MLFRNLAIGQKFKYKDRNISGDEIRVKVLVVTNGIRGVPSYGHMSLNNTVFVCTPGFEDNEVLTLQKTTKIEKKWISKEFKDIPLGGRCKAHMDTPDHASFVKARQIDTNNYGTYSAAYHTFLLREDSSRLYVEEEVKVETEEWLP